LNSVYGPRVTGTDPHQKGIHRQITLYRVDIIVFEAQCLTLHPETTAGGIASIADASAAMALPEPQRYFFSVGSPSLPVPPMC
jgi:hypothetical protein